MTKDEVRALIEPAIAHRGYTTFEDVWGEIERHEKILWTGERSAVVLMFWDYPTHRACVVQFAGGDLEEIQSLEPHLQQFARDCGATTLEMRGRKGWARSLPGWEVTEIIMERRL